MEQTDTKKETAQERGGGSLRARDCFVALVLFLLIYAVPLGTLLRGKTDGASDGLFAADTKHTAAETPIQQLQQGAEAFNSHLFLKSNLIALNRGAVRLASGGTYLASTQVLAGKEHWLFFKSETDGETIADYMGTNRYTQERMAELASRFQILEGKLAARGIELYVLCIPDKEVVYEEYMPENYVRLYTPSRGEQLTEYINEHTGITMLYPREALQDAKRYGQVYYSTDTHYNHLGAFVVLQDFFAAAYGDSRTPDTVQFLIPWDDYAGDLATVAGVAPEYRQDDVYTINIESVDHTQYHDQCILIIGDSFADFLCTEAALYYREAYSVGVGAYEESMLDLYQPDIVIWETGERRLSAFE